jgi:hypothetical protein
MEEQAELDPAAAFVRRQAAVIRRQRCSNGMTKAREDDKIHHQQLGEGLSISKARHHVPKRLSASHVARPICLLAPFPRFRQSSHTRRFSPSKLSDHRPLTPKPGPVLTHCPRPIPLLPLLARSPSMLHHQHKRRGRFRQSQMRTRP